VLLIRVFGWAEGLAALLVPVGACALTLAVLAGIGVPINLFHIVGLALVLGIGLDYTLFLKFGRSMSQTILAVLLAAVTTECAFGLLGLSRVGAINSFGVTVALGVAFAFLLAPMSAAPRADS
jgi:predicted exporter